MPEVRVPPSFLGRRNLALQGRLASDLEPQSPPPPNGEAHLPIPPLGSGLPALSPVFLFLHGGAAAVSGPARPPRPRPARSGSQPHLPLSWPRKPTSLRPARGHTVRSAPALGKVRAATSVGGSPLEFPSHGRRVTAAGRSRRPRAHPPGLAGGGLAAHGGLSGRGDPPAAGPRG